jgi:hypothetical protein
LGGDDPLMIHFIFVAMVFFTPLLAWMWITGQIRDRAFRNNTRRHFSRPSFSVISKDGKLFVNGGPNPDHAQRTQNSMREWRGVERRLKRLPIIWLLMLIIVGYFA